MVKRAGTRPINRSARTGKFVTKGYRRTHKSTTETERRPFWRRFEEEVKLLPSF